VHGPFYVSTAKGRIAQDGLEQALLDKLNALPPTMAIIYGKTTHCIPWAHFLGGCSVVIFHVPPAPKCETVCPTQLKLRTAIVGTFERSDTYGMPLTRYDMPVTYARERIVTARVHRPRQGKSTTLRRMATLFCNLVP
jgi:hypothetical protein